MSTAGPLSFLRATVSAWAAALVLTWFAPRRPFDQLLERLRDGKPFVGDLAAPMLHLAIVNRLLRFLPPFGMGPCMKRSLLLFHLWSRCGLNPRLHLGVAGAGEMGYSAHAWLTAELEGASLAAGSGEGYAEAFVLPPPGDLGGPDGDAG